MTPNSKNLLKKKKIINKRGEPHQKPHKVSTKKKKDDPNEKKKLLNNPWIHP